jgi:DNA repair exonuclease SbcCD nuclease subunit
MVGKVNDFTIVDKTCEIDGITFVPYQHNPNSFPKETRSICVAHQTFKGADYGDITTKDGVDADAVSADIIISGHIHKKQVLGKVIYPGSPFSQSVSDINQVKGLIMFDTTTLKNTFIKCPLPIWRGDKFTLDQTFSIDDLHAYVEANIKGSSDHWVIDITGTKADISSYLSSKRHREAIEGVDVKIKTSYVDKEKRQIRIEALSIEDIVSQYVTKVYSGSLDKDLLKTKALELLKP